MVSIRTFQRRLQKTITITYPGEQQATIVTRNDDGYFACKRCPSRIRNPNWFRSHVLKCMPDNASDSEPLLGSVDDENVEEEEVDVPDEEEAVVPNAPNEFPNNAVNDFLIGQNQSPLRVIVRPNVIIGNDIRVTDAMSAFNVIYNIRYNLIVCLSCGFVVSKDSLKHHLRRHGQKGGRFSYTDLLNSLDGAENAAGGLAIDPLMPNLIVQGLSVHYGGRKCRNCYTFYRDSKSYIKHWNAIHDDDDLANDAVYPVQTLRNKPHVSYFEVQEDAANANGGLNDINQDDQDAVMELFRDRMKMEENLHGTARTDSRVWTLADFSSYLEPFTHEQMSSLISTRMVSPQDSRIWPSMLKASQMFIRKVNESIGRDWRNRTCLQQGSNRPEYFKPFSKLQEESTIDTYGEEVALLIVFYIRLLNHENDEGISRKLSQIPAEFWITIENVRSTAAAAFVDLRQLAFKIQTLFYHVATRVQMDIETRDSLFLFPWIAMKAYKARRSIRSITTDLAKVKFAIRGSLYLEIRGQYWRGMLSNDLMAEQANSWIQDHDLLLTNDTFPDDVKVFYELLGNGFNGNIQLLSQIKSLIEKQGRSSTAAPKIWVTDPEHLILTSGQDVSLRRIRSGLQKLVASANGKLDSILHPIQMERLNISRSETETWKDVCYNSQVGYGFSTEMENRLRNVMDLASSKVLILGLAERGTNGALNFDDVKVNQFMVAAGNLVKEIACLVLWTGGNPPRSTEFLEASFRNTSSSFRSLFLINDSFVFVSEYVKYSNTNSSEMPILRVLPKAVSEIIFNYLILIRPLEVVLASYLFRNEPSCANHYRSSIFVVQGRLLVDSFADIFRRVNQTILGMNIGINDHRHLTDSYLKMHYKESMLSKQLQVLDDQAGHRSMTAGLVYGRTQRDLPGIPTFMAVYFRNASKIWHRLIGFPDIEESSAHDTIVTSSSRLMQSPFSLSQLRGEIRSAMDKSMQPFQILLQNQRSQDPCSLDIGGFFIHPNAYALSLQVLRQLLNADDATYRSVYQKRSIALAIQGNSIMSILNTSGGKTLVAISSMFFHSSKVYILILPTVELVRKWSRDLTSSGINFVLWKSDWNAASQGHRQCYLVTPESLEDFEFWNLLHELQFTDRLGYVVIDEAHLLMGWNEFRFGYTNLNLLNARWPCRLMLLSATIPPLMAKALVEYFSTSFAIVRQPSCRHNHCINVRINVTIEDILEEESQLLPLSSKIMIFVPTRNMVDTISRSFEENFPAINFRSYHSRLDEEERRSAIEHWSSDSDNTHCIVGTSALTVGLDLPNVDTILVIGYSYGVLELCQQMGRGGRDQSRHSNIRIYADLEKARNASSFNSSVNEFIQFVTFDGCYRYRLGQEIDGQGFVCKDDDDNLLCSYCRLLESDDDRGNQGYQVMSEASNIGQGIRIHASLLAFYTVEEFITQKLKKKCIHCLLIGQDCNHLRDNCSIHRCYSCLSPDHFAANCDSIVHNLASCRRCCLPLRVGEVSIHPTLPSANCGPLEKIILSIGHHLYQANSELRASHSSYKDFLQWMYEIKGGNTNGCFLAAHYINKSNF